MKIIIAGLDQAGILLADLLSKEEHDVVVIDKNPKKVDYVTDKYNVSGVCGNSVSPETLQRAGADTADVCVALTGSDETNLCICLLAKSQGTRFAAAQITKQELTERQECIRKEFRVDYLLTPKEDTATEIAHHIGLPGNVRADGFFSSDTVLIRVAIQGGSSFVNMPLREVRTFFGTDLLVGIVERAGKVLIPDGAVVLKEGDEVGFVVPHDSLNIVMEKLGIIRERVKKVLIIGGGDVAVSLAEKLVSEKKKVTILDNDSARCAVLAQKLPKVTVSCAREIDAQVLVEEGIGSADVCVSLTGRDDTNLVLSMFAWSCGVGSIITKVNSASYERLLNRVNIDITISPVLIVVERILRFIRDVSVPNEAGNDIACMYRIAGGKAEAIEFVVYDDFRACGIPLKSPEFKRKKEILIATIVRGGKVMLADGSSQIHPGDHVVVITHKNSGLTTINDILTR